MPWSYTGNPGADLKDAVRFYIGDTNEEDQLVQDGEIHFLLNTTGNNVLRAAVLACEHIAAQFSRLCDESVGSIHVSYSKKAENMWKLRDELSARAAKNGLNIYAGGISEFNNAKIQDADIIEPAFTSTMFDNPKASTNPYNLEEL